MYISDKIQTIVNCQWGSKVIWQENYYDKGWQKKEFETIKDWFDWMNNRRSPKAILNGQLIVGNFKAAEDKPKEEIDTLLTRQEAIDIAAKHFPNSITLQKSIDFYVALGMLKLKKEKQIDNVDAIVKSIENVIAPGTLVEVSMSKTQQLVMIIKELLNIVNRRKP